MIFRFLPLVLLLLGTAPTMATSIFDRLSEVETEAALNVVLSLPTDSLLAKKIATQDATFSFQDADGREQNWTVEVSLRGNRWFDR